MIERLILNDAAYFYRSTGRLTSTLINSTFQLVSRSKTGRLVSKLVNETKNYDDKVINYSLCIFRTKGKPSFLDSAGSEEEQRYSYVLLIQYSNMLIVSKKNVSGVEKFLSEYINEIDYVTISRLFLNDRAFFEKFSMSNMDVSDTAVRRRNIEAMDLKSSFSPIYASKYILNSIRIKDQDSNRITLALNTSKINRLGKKGSFDDYLRWVIEVVDKIENFQPQESYLDNFSTPIKVQETLGRLVPTSVLFHFGELLDQLDRGDVERIEYRADEQKIRTINFQHFINSFNTFCEVNVTNIEGTERAINWVKNPIDKRLELKKLKTSMKINSSSKLKNIYIVYAASEVRLIDYINNTQSFIVTFSEFDVVYTNKRLFKDNKLLANLETFIDVFEEYPALESTLSEKGNVESHMTRFERNTLFDFVDSVLALNSDYLFCDDFGNEFADFISIKNQNSVCFYHAKHASSQFSASDFQVVIGQALKNIGNMTPSTAQLEQKRTRWNSLYSGSSIAMMRKGDSIENGIASFTKTLNHPNATSHIYIVVNYISKSRVISELNELRHGGNTSAQTIQLFWLLSSFISTCKELGFQAHITCKP
ncbi:hypothetical protein [Paenibacillus gorillae]|uniref:hypothetical protein n=1 Tax=Paenibacillus gorillae TaxID=1243662 RepID=UPI0004BAF979|nr:hypothetical protein [Paenibacillus gorillae]